jgi:hypothetical protein
VTAILGGCSTSLFAVVVLVASSSGRVALAAALLAVQLVLVAGWFRSAHLTTVGQASGALAAVAAAVAADIVLLRVHDGANVRALAGVLAGLVILAFVVQLARRDGRERLTNALAASVATGALAVAVAVLMAVRGGPHGSTVIAVALTSVAVGVLPVQRQVPLWASLPGGLAVGAGAGLLVSRQTDAFGLGAAAVIALVAVALAVVARCRGMAGRRNPAACRGAACRARRRPHHGRLSARGLVMGRPARLLVVVGIVAALGYGADRIAAHVAADRIASIVKTDAGLASTPHVKVQGFPFVTQAVSGHYRRIDMTANDIFQTGQLPGSVLRLTFADVRIPLSTVLSGNVNSVPVGTVTGSVTVPFANLQAAADVAGLSILSGVPGSPDEIKVSEVVKVPTGNLTVLLTARVTAHGDSIVVTPVDLTTANGTPVPAAVKTQVLAQAVLSVKLPGLPTGVGIAAVSVTNIGVLVVLHAVNLTLTR